MRSFWVHKIGTRAGKPFSQCVACERVRRGRMEQSGLVLVSRVFFIFEELEARVGRWEAARLIGVSPKLWHRLDNRVYKRMYKQTVYKAMVVLQELRDKDVVRHRDSIKHGAAARGRVEREVTSWGDVYRPETPLAKKARLAADAERKRKEREQWSEARRKIESRKRMARNVPV